MSIIPDELFKPKQPLSAQEVAEYLQAHPEFFLEHEQLLSHMSIPHVKGSAVSLVERQMQILREENQQLQRQINNMMQAARENENLNVRIQQLIIDLLATQDLPSFFETLYAQLKEDFNTDFAVLKLFDMALPNADQLNECVEYDAEVFNLFESVLKMKTPICGRITQAQANYLFAGETIHSAVLIPLGAPESQGILALGSSDVARFHAGMSTDLLNYMGHLIGHMLRRWLV